MLLAGAEGTRAATRARKVGCDLPWTPPGRRPAMRSFGPELERAAAVGISRALHCFPLYEHGLRAHEGQTLDDAQRESAAMWAELARVAATSPYAWTRTGARAQDVARVGPDNRMISFPYPKSLTANPFVNQGAALFVTDTESARGLGIPESRWVYPLGGAGADEPADPRTRGVPPRPRARRDRPRRAGRDQHHARCLRRRRALQLFSRYAQADAARARAPGRRGHLGGRRTLVLRWTREQLPHPLARGAGRAAPRRRRHRVRSRRRDVQHQAPRSGPGRPPAARRRVPGAPAPGGRGAVRRSRRRYR